MQWVINETMKIRFCDVIGILRHRSLVYARIRMLIPLVSSFRYHHSSLIYSERRHGLQQTKIWFNIKRAFEQTSGGNSTDERDTLENFTDYLVPFWWSSPGIRCLRSEAELSMMNDGRAMNRVMAWNWSTPSRIRGFNAKPWASSGPECSAMVQWRNGSSTQWRNTS